MPQRASQAFTKILAFALSKARSHCRILSQGVTLSDLGLKGSIWLVSDQTLGAKGWKQGAQDRVHCSSWGKRRRWLGPGWQR